MSTEIALNDFVVVMILLLVAVIVLVTLAQRLHVPYPILLVVGGLVLGFIPVVPDVKLTQELVFLIFLPPLFLWEALNVSLRDLRANSLPIAALVIGLVIATTIFVGEVAQAVVADLSLAAALVLGAVVSPTDMVAASSIAQRLHLPGRIVSILEGESLFNDATGLVLYSVTLSIISGRSFSLLAASGLFLFVCVVGIVVGLVIGFLISLMRRYMLDEPTLENTLLLLTGYVSYLIAEYFHASGVLAVVVTGLFLGSKRVALSSSQTRLQMEEFWSVVVFLLNSLLFILVGLQLPTINAAVVRLYSLDALILYAGAVVLAVMVIRLIWVMLAFYLPGRLFSQKKPGRTSFAGALIIGWCGMRGGISLAAVLALPGNFPSASLVVFLVFCVILATLVLQGLSLPWLIKKLHVSNKDTVETMEMRARLEMARASLRTLDSLVEDTQKVSSGIANLQNRYAQICRTLATQLDEENIDEDQKQTVVKHTETRKRIRQEIIDAQRETLTALVNQRKLPEEIAHRLNRELDLDEVLLSSRHI